MTTLRVLPLDEAAREYREALVERDAAFARVRDAQEALAMAEETSRAAMDRVNKAHAVLALSAEAAR